MRYLLWALVVGVAASGCRPQDGVGTTAPAEVTAADLKAGYDRLTNGMTFAEADEVMGGGGRELGRSSLPTGEEIRYVWGDLRGAYVLGHFGDGRLNHKGYSPR